MSPAKTLLGSGSQDKSSICFDNDPAIALVVLQPDRLCIFFNHASQFLSLSLCLLFYPSHLQTVLIFFSFLYHSYFSRNCLDVYLVMCRWAGAVKKDYSYIWAGAITQIPPINAYIVNRG